MHGKNLHYKNDSRLMYDKLLPTEDHLNLASVLYIYIYICVCVCVCVCVFVQSSCIIFIKRTLSIKSVIVTLRLTIKCTTRIIIYIRYMRIFICLSAYSSFSICFKDYTKSQAEVVVAKGQLYQLQDLALLHQIKMFSD